MSDTTAQPTVDPVSLQVFTGALGATCEEMGAVLVRASHSANIKERRDCSTALFSPQGELVMQAEHIPVHLGSMPDAVAAVREEEHEPGVSWILNDPFRGGTHLPDVTVITPAFSAAGEGLLGFAASRAHHADVGGPTPGGMPVSSTCIDDEGVLIPPLRVDGERLRELASLMRNPKQRLADLRAQLAANAVGVSRLQELETRYGAAVLPTILAEILDYAERRSRAALADLPNGTWTAEELLEGGSDGSADVRLRVAATIDGDSMTLDFAGTDPQVSGNLNCPLPVTKSAVLFAVKAVLDPDAPASAGANRPIEVVAPSGCLVNAQSPAAVAAGNVETSCRVADLTLEALAAVVPVPAQGQGTMNNLTLASDSFTYYETLAGGQGACPDADGPSAVHVTMSNTLNTPIEALEAEYPVRVRELSLRRRSGGGGRHRGGDGLIRELEALEPLRFTLITERRRHAPKGRDGGRPGKCGRNFLNDEELPSKCEGWLRPGDRLRIETPGGGGYGIES